MVRGEYLQFGIAVKTVQGFRRVRPGDERVRNDGVIYWSILYKAARLRTREWVPLIHVVSVGNDNHGARTNPPRALLGRA